MTTEKVEDKVDAQRIAESTWAKLLERIVVPVALAVMALLGSQMMATLDKIGTKTDKLTTDVATLSGKVDQGLVERIASSERRIGTLEAENRMLRDKLDSHILSSASK